MQLKHLRFSQWISSLPTRNGREIPMLSESVHWKQFKVRDYEARQWGKARLRYRFLEVLLKAIDTGELTSVENMPSRMGCSKECIWRLLNSDPELKRMYYRYRRFALNKGR